LTAEPRISTADFEYELPGELIAQEPLPERTASRMLVVIRADRRTGAPADRRSSNRAPGGRRSSSFRQPVMLPGDTHHDVDRLNLADQRQVFSVFFVSDGDGVYRHALLVAEHSQDVAGWHAAEGVKAFLREPQPVPLSNGLPGAPVQRHGVRQSAVAIEDDSMDHDLGEFRFGLRFRV